MNPQSLTRTVFTSGLTATAGLALALGALLVAPRATATPYATCLTNDAGTISFRLNEDATNSATDSVTIIGNSDTMTNNIGPLPVGLTITNMNTSFGMTGGVFRVVVKKEGAGSITPISPVVPFNAARGVTVNTRAASPYFGRVYVANTSAGTKGDGLFAYSADLFDILGQGATAKTGGITNFSAGGTSSPYRVKVGHDDDMLYVCDWSDSRGNLYVVGPDLATAAYPYALKQLTTNAGGTAISAAIPPGVGLDNVHGSVAAAEVWGTQAGGNLVIYTVDEDYQTDPTQAFATEMNSLWEYQVGAGPLPWSNAPSAKRLTPNVNFTSQTMDLARGTNGNLYVTQYRSSGAQTGVYVVDSAGNLVWDSKAESGLLGFSSDVLLAAGGLTVSPDQKYLAVCNLENNVITVVPMVNGIPNLAGRFQYTDFGTTGNARGIAFDAADNLYFVSSGLALFQSLSLGLTTTATTSSDGTFSLLLPTNQVTVASLDTNVLAEADVSTVANITLQRANDDLSKPVKVNFTMSGTATRGTDYVLKTNSVAFTANAVTIPAGVGSLVITLTVLDDAESESVETARFNLSGGNYEAVAPFNQTVAIIDNDTPAIDISAAQGQMFEANSNDYVRVRLTRRGDTNAASFTVNLNYSGVAASNVDFVAVPSVTIDPGVLSADVDITPIDDALLEGTETFTVTAASGGTYIVGTNATFSIIDDEVPAAPVLFSDNLNGDSSTNWSVKFQAGNGTNDYRINEQANTFPATAYDYSADGIPRAPHGSDTLGLKVTVNKDQSDPLGGAGVNLYPNGQSFSGNYALRFDMYLILNSGAGTTEYALFGINHSGNVTNWFRNSGDGVGTNSAADGLWFNVEADGAALGDYVLNTAPILNAGGVYDPTGVVSRAASTLTGVFKSPPWQGSSGPGAPANVQSSTTPSWAQVEVSQIANLITLKINNSTILTYTNTGPYQSGNIMLGYDDAYDSNTGTGAAAIYDNVRVVDLGRPQITSIVSHVSTTGVPSGTTALNTNSFVNFTWTLDDPTSAFKVQRATSVAGPYADVGSAIITKVSPGIYTAAAGESGAASYFRIRR